IRKYSEPHREYEDCDEYFICLLKNSTLQESILSFVKSTKFAVHDTRYCIPVFSGAAEETYAPPAAVVENESVLDL
ncbi:1310_t:CDS:2, partial [Racocetra persica]